MTEPRTMMMREAQVRLRSEADRSVDVVASTEAVDSYESVLTANWRLERYAANPVVLFAHKSREMPIARAENVRVEKGELLARLVFATEDINPVAEQVWRAVKGGFLRGVSVGFDPRTVRVEKRDGRELLVLDDNELLEISMTPVPANPEALAAMRARALDLRTAPPSPEPRMTTKNINASLGLPSEADEATACATATGLRSVLAATGKSTAAEALGHIEGLKVRAARVDELEGELTKVRAADEKRVRDELVAGAERDGKLPPGNEKLRAQLLTLPIEGARALVEALPVQVKRAPEAPSGPAPSGAGASAGGNRFARSLDVSTEQLAESRKDLETRGVVRREQE